VKNQKQERQSIGGNGKRREEVQQNSVAGWGPTALQHVAAALQHLLL